MCGSCRRIFREQSCHSMIFKLSLDGSQSKWKVIISIMSAHIHVDGSSFFCFSRIHSLHSHNQQQCSRHWCNCGSSGCCLCDSSSHSSTITSSYNHFAVSSRHFNSRHIISSFMWTLFPSYWWDRECFSWFSCFCTSIEMDWLLGDVWASSNECQTKPTHFYRSIAFITTDTTNGWKLYSDYKYSFQESLNITKTKNPYWQN